MEDIVSYIDPYYQYSQNTLYNYLIGSYTKILYQKFFESIPDNSIILDVGVGNGNSLIANKDLIIKKNLNIVGIDINNYAINMATESVIENDLSDYIQLKCMNVFDYETDLNLNYVYFSNSFSVIPNILVMIKHLNDKFLKKNNGEIVISTTVEAKDHNIKSFLKKNANYMLLGIELGTLTTFKDLLNNISKNNLYVNKTELVYNTWYPMWGEINIYTFNIKSKNEDNFITQ
jgi:SAM-dependent methyltransferase